MAKRKKNEQQMISLIDKLTRLGKISNNLELHGDEEVTAFQIPVEGVMLDAKELCALLEDKFAHQLIFNDKRGLKEPTDALRKLDALKLKDNFEGATVIMTLTGDRELEFDECNLKELTLEPQVGGLTALAFKVYLRPGIGANNLLLQEHQHREVKLTITNATVAMKAKSRQQDLPLSNGEDDDGEDEAEEAPKPKRRGRGEARAH